MKSLPGSIPLAIGALLLTCGCPTVSGTIEGERVQAASTFFVEHDGHFEQEDGSPGDDEIMIVVSSFTDSCSRTARIADDVADAETPEEAAEVWRSIAKRDFWELRVHVRTADLSADLGDATLEGVAWDLPLDGPGQAYVGFRHYREWLDEEYWQTEEDPDSEYSDFWYSDLGDLSIGSHTPGSRITGRFETAAADWETGEHAGDVTISFDARRCLQAERELY